MLRRTFIKMTVSMAMINAIYLLYLYLRSNMYSGHNFKLIHTMLQHQRALLLAIKGFYNRKMMNDIIRYSISVTSPFSAPTYHTSDMQALYYSLVYT